MAIKPYYTSDDLIEAIKRKISMPISQATFTSQDVLSFCNDEMFISQVPSVLQYHEEFFVYSKSVPLQSNISRYAIPDRAIGMKLRDLFYQDTSGNLFEMARVNPDDRAFFQANVGASGNGNQFFLQGNDVIINPSITSNPTGSLLFVFFLRPNQLVLNDRSATISGFNQTIQINDALIQALDTVTIDNTIFTAVSAGGGTITAIEANGLITEITTSTPHQLSDGQKAVIASSDSVPNINGTYSVSIISSTKFSINKEIGVDGTTGTFTSPNQFLISGTDAGTAANLTSAINVVGLGSNGVISATSSTDTIQVTFQKLNATFETSRTVAFVIPSQTIGIQFEDVPTTFQDPDTSVTEDLFADGVTIDLLQRKPGHRTWAYDIMIPTGGISGDSVFFNKDDLLIPTMTSGSDASIIYQLPDLVPGDYMCLANEAIIPQIPPDLHTALAERAATRILSAQGDTQGVQDQMAKLQEIEQRQGNLIDNRVTGAPMKVFNRNSLLRSGRRFGRR